MDTHVSNYRRACQAVLTVIIIFFSLSSHAALMGSDLDGNPGNDVIYDDVLDLTWLADANLAGTMDFGVSGIGSDGMDWSTANQWIAAMNQHDGNKGYLGINTWRLPYQYQSYSELSYMYSENFQAKVITDGISPFGLGSAFNTANLMLFNNIQSNRYWTGTENSQNTNQAWGFEYLGGTQGPVNKDRPGFVWAVSSGDVAATSTVLEPAVPVPAAIWLFSGALMGLLGIARRGK